MKIEVVVWRFIVQMLYTLELKFYTPNFEVRFNLKKAVFYILI